MIDEMTGIQEWQAHEQKAAVTYPDGCEIEAELIWDLLLYRWESQNSARLIPRVAGACNCGSPGCYSEGTF